MSPMALAVWAVVVPFSTQSPAAAMPWIGVLLRHDLGDELQVLGVMLEENLSNPVQRRLFQDMLSSAVAVPRGSSSSSDSPGTAHLGVGCRRTRSPVQILGEEPAIRKASTQRYQN